MGGDKPKQFQPLLGLPVYLWSVRFFLSHAFVKDVAVVVPSLFVDETHAALTKFLSQREHLFVVPGGERRQDSVRNGLNALKSTSSLVAVHDAARPFPPPHFDVICAQAQRTGAAIFGYPLVETVKRVDENLVITETLDRSCLWGAQTTQVFRTELLYQALEYCQKHGIEVTDDAAAVALLGFPVNVVQGSRWNIKLTVPEDWIIANSIAASLEAKESHDGCDQSSSKGASSS